MDAVTYPEAVVQEYLHNHLVCAKFNLFERSDDMRELTKITKVAWSPMFVVLDERRRELRRFLGWLPATDLIAELALACHYQKILLRDFTSARQGLRSIAETAPQSAAAPEALFWAGIAGFLSSDKDLGELKQDWEEVRRCYPDSSWAQRCSVTDDVPEPA
jgi:hypothetical protein